MKFKFQLLLLALLPLGALNATSQTASNLVAQGRAYLAASNLLSANLSFSNAVVASPGDPNANFFYALTRVLVLPSQTAGSNFLTRWGVPVAGRDLYDWTARLQKDTSGVVIAPAGVNADEATALLRTNILGVIISAEAGLALITDTNFTVTLTAQETTSSEVTVDYGDIQVIRALADATAYFIYNTYEWNLSAQLQTIRSFYANGTYSFESLLTTYPGLLTFSSTNDLINAKTVFTNGVNRYLAGSQFIRARPAGVTRLFNYDPSNYNDVHNEANFRSVLADLVSSLQGPVTLSVNAGYTVDLGAQFTGTHPPRGFLPRFHDDGFVVGSFPDATFGGLITGFTSDEFESGLARFMNPIPNILEPFRGPGFTFNFPVAGVTGRGYVVQVSTDLEQWSDFQPFVSLGGEYQFTDSIEPGSSRKFYRVVDRTGDMPAPPNDDFANRIPLTGLGFAVPGYNINATTEQNEPGYINSTVWWSWTAPSSGVVVVSLAGSTGGGQTVNVYTGSDLADLAYVSAIYYDNLNFNGYAFQAVAGTEYQIQVGGYDPSGGGFKLLVTSLPTLTLNSPSTNEITLPGIEPVLLSATATDTVGTITQLAFQGGNGLIASTTNSSLSYTWTNMSVGYNNVEIIATDNLGFQVETYLTIIVPPPNDNFVNAIPITGLPVSVTGLNEGATLEVGEPIPPSSFADASVWWSWTAPSDATVTAVAGLDQGGGYLYNSILGVYAGNTVSALTAIGSSVPNDGYPAAVTFNATAGVNYKLAVEGEYGATGNITLQVVPFGLPGVTILTPTNGATYYSDTNITLTASASSAYLNIESVEYDVVVGTNYYIIGTANPSPFLLDWWYPSPGDYSIVAIATDSAGSVSAYSAAVNITVLPPPPPVNDDFVNRTTISGTDVNVQESNVGATREPGEPFIAGNAGGASVWWQWKAPASGLVTISTYGSDFDTLLGVYAGNSVSALTLVADDDDYGGFVTSQVTFNAQQGTAYQIAVDGYDGGTGNIVLSLTEQ